MRWWKSRALREAELENDRLWRENARLQANLDEVSNLLEESNATYHIYAIPTLNKAVEMNRAYIEHMRHCPDPDAGEHPHDG